MQPICLIAGVAIYLIHERAEKEKVKVLLSEKEKVKALLPALLPSRV